MWQYGPRASPSRLHCRRGGARIRIARGGRRARRRAQRQRLGDAHRPGDGVRLPGRVLRVPGAASIHRPGPPGGRSGAARPALRAGPRPVAGDPHRRRQHRRRAGGRSAARSPRAGSTTRSPRAGCAPPRRSPPTSAPSSSWASTSPPGAPRSPPPRAARSWTGSAAGTSTRWRSATSPTSTPCSPGTGTAAATSTGRAAAATAMADYTKQFTQWAHALPNLPLAGPAASRARRGWASSATFISAEPRLGLVTYHRYPLRACVTDAGQPRLPVDPQPAGRQRLRRPGHARCRRSSRSPTSTGSRSASPR